MLIRRIAVLLISAMVYCASMGTASAAPFGVGDFVTYSQDDWGGYPTPNPATQLLVANFDGLYGGGVEIGIPLNAGWSIIFTSTFAVLNYLPSSGAPGPLTADLVDPTSTSSGLLGGSVLALQLNVDFNDAGFLHGTNSALFGDLILTELAFTPEFNGYSVRQFLEEANLILGGGPTTATYEDVFFLVQDLGSAFNAGSPSAFAQDHLLLPAVAVVPEPATLALLALGLAGLGFARRRTLN